MTSDATMQATGRDSGFREHAVPELDVLLRVARRLTGSPDTAEDLVRETLIRAFRAVDRFDGRHPRAWLLTILWNTWKNMNRRARPLLADSPEEILARVPARGADGRTGAEEQVVEAGFDKRLAQALTDLVPIHQEVVLLVDVDGLSCQATADVLGVPIGTVMSRLHRARRQLRNRLEREGLLQAYLDAEVPDSAALLVADHLDDCRRCGLEADAFRALVASLARLSCPDEPERLARLRSFAAELAATA
jgi:RNA polymerase sigma-70 factor, ECF subfamily